MLFSRKSVLPAMFGLFAITFAVYGILNAKSAPLPVSQFSQNVEVAKLGDLAKHSDLAKEGDIGKMSDLEKEGDIEKMGDFAKDGDIGGDLLW